METPLIPEAPRTRRWRQGTVAKREIKRLQKSTEFMIRPHEFRTWVRALLPEGLRVGSTALEALQTAVESFGDDLFRRSQRWGKHAHRLSIHSSDVHQAAYDLFNGAWSLPDAGGALTEGPHLTTSAFFDAVLPPSSDEGCEGEVSAGEDSSEGEPPVGDITAPPSLAV